MKKRKILLFFITAILVFAACSNTEESDSRHKRKREENDSSTNKEISVSLPDGDDDIPSEELVTKNLIEALSLKNEYASLSAVETIRTKTKDKTFEINLQLDAVSKYADWNYELIMQYTNYDQGWMLDQVTWNSESYVQTRLPDTQEMAEYVAEYYGKSNPSSPCLPVNNATMEFGYDDTLQCEIMKFEWDSIESYLHAFRAHHNTAFWTYDPQIDNWKLVERKDKKLEITPNYDLNFNGEWEGRFTISNFTWDGFDAEIRYGYVDNSTYETVWEQASGHFKHVANPSDYPEAVTYWCNNWPCVFATDDGKWIYFEFEENRTIITFRNGRDKLAKSGSVTILTSLE